MENEIIVCPSCKTEHKVDEEYLNNHHIRVFRTLYGIATGGRHFRTTETYGDHPFAICSELWYSLYAERTDAMDQ